MIKTKKQMFIVIVVFALVLFLGGTTFAWFNYSRTTSDQQLIAGDIYLHLNEGNDQISMTNIFPETADEARARNDNYITFNVSGLNTSTKTIYYEFVLNHGDDKASPKTRYRDEDLRFDLVELDSNGNEGDYLLSAVSYETLANRRIYVDTVDANTTTEVVKRYKLRMWLDENVIISDTAADAVYNTTEYKNKYATVKLTVAGDLQEKTASRSLYTIMRNDSVGIDTENGVDFSKTPEHDGLNGEGTNGVYTRSGTETNSNPIFYYRGEVDNNVLFNNKCWKAVRTTYTGGVKLIYNGELSTNKKELTLEEYGTPVTNTGNFTYDSTDNTWNATVTSSNAEIKFKVPVAGNYSIIVKGIFGSGTILALLGGTGKGATTGPQDQSMIYYYDYGPLTTSNTIGVRASGSEEHPYVMKVKVLYEDSTLGIGCDNMGESTGITVNDTNLFKFNQNSSYQTFVGYMYGATYSYSTSNWKSGARFGSSFVWDGIKYTLVDDSVTTPDQDHHYSCNVETENGTCTQLRYVFYVSSGNAKYYITLTGGDGIEEAFVKMQTNTNDSVAKNNIDTWYASNMNTVTSKLEDTIWCNDRSMGDGNNNGWIANGGDLSTHLYYGAYQRSAYASDTSLVKNQPNLACANKNDAFTWKNSAGNSKLDYPVGMLTEDEMVLAGGVAELGTYSYLNSYSYYWSLSPKQYNSSGAVAFCWNTYRNRSEFVGAFRGLRPAISLKSSTQVISGNGTVTNPYVIE